MVNNEHEEEQGNNVLLSVQSLPDLSDEVLLEVLYHIHPIDILRVASTISKRFASLTTSRDGNLRYWRYHPCLPDRLKARIEEEVPLVEGGKSSADIDDDVGSNDAASAAATGAIPGPPLLDRRQLQILCCRLCSESHDTADTASAHLPKLLRKVDLLPSSNDAAAALISYVNFKSSARAHAAKKDAAKKNLLLWSSGIIGSYLPRTSGRCCVASSEDHEHEAVHNVLRALSPAAKRRRRRDVRGLREGGDDDDEEDGDQTGGGTGRGVDLTERWPHPFDPTGDSDSDEDGDDDGDTPYSDSGVPKDSYDAMWDRMASGASDLGPTATNGNVTLDFFMAVMGQEGTYWSSRPSDDRNSREILLFATQHAQDALITDVAVKPFRELRMDDSHVAFTWPEATLSVYRLPVAARANGGEHESKSALWSDGTIIDPTPVQQQPMPLHGDATTDASRLLSEQVSPASVATGESADPRDDSDGSPQSILTGHKPVYVSDPWEASRPNDTGWQNFHLPCGIVGNLIVISLNGKYHEQFSESGYYACVERVECRGVPLCSEK